jgi:Fe-S-cluster containining protein
MQDFSHTAIPKEPGFIEMDLQTRFGRLRGKLPIPANGMRLAELAWNAMALDGKLIDMAIASEAKQNRPVACQKGCGACCRQAVPLSPAEAWMLADIVAAMPPDRKTLVLQRFAAAHERLQSAGFGDRSLDGKANEMEVLALGLDYFRLGIACPFLEAESCSIHPSRPSACREYLVTSPASHCADPGKLAITPVPLALSLTEALSKLSAMVMETDPQVIPMTLALEWAMAHRTEGQRRFDGTFLLTSLVELLNKPAIR